MFVHHEGLVVAYTWNREKQMFVALGKEFDMYVNTQFVKSANTFFGCVLATKVATLISFFPQECLYWVSCGKFSTFLTSHCKTNSVDFSFAREPDRATGNESSFIELSGTV